MRINKIILFLAIFIPLTIVFKNFFLPGPLAWGDAPHFYPEMLKELVNEPLAWTNRGNSFGGVNLIVWLSPIMFLYGLIGSVFGNDLAIRILFYFPSVILAGVGTYFFTRYLKLSKIGSFFSVLTYLLNTYYLLLIDGGQVGVALAYGLFPFSILFLKKLIDSPSLKSFYLSLIFLSLNSIADPRIAAISVLVIIVWGVLTLKFKNLVYLIPLGIATVGINAYWIIPLLRNASIGSIVSGPGTIRWYDPVLLFSPHWPSNLFGVISRPPIYFLGVPLLIFSGLLFNRSKNLLIFTFLFLIFSFLFLGLPFVDKIPLGFAFRDSTKFFIPLVLFAGILTGHTVEALSKRLKKYPYYLLLVICYLYLLFLVHPALLGKMNFNLSNRQASGDFQKIYENLRKDSGFFRTAWFPERHPLAYETFDRPAIDARDLTNFRPFADINASEDVFNFLNNENFVDWYKVLGIKYLMMSDNPRETSKDETQQKDWLSINRLIASSNRLRKVNLGDLGTQVPIYEVSRPYPRFYAVKKLVGVIGSPLVPSIDSPTLFFEDGKWDPHFLEGKDANSIELFFNGSDKVDLAMSFLERYFLSPKEATKNEWAVYSSEEYLKYKYELLIRGVKFADFDYSKGIAFSTKKGEKVEFTFKVPEAGDYVFVQRTMTPSKGESSLKWTAKSLTLPKGKHKEVIENDSDLEIFNVTALIPRKDFDDAQKLADTFTNYFKVANANDLRENEGFTPVDMEKWGTLKYKFSMPEGFRWLILTDNYNELWKLRQGNEYHNSVPVFSMVNGFYAEDKWTNIGIEFKGQENLRWGIYWSGISILTFMIIYLWFSSKDKKEV